MASRGPLRLPKNRSQNQHQQQSMPSQPNTQFYQPNNPYPQSQMPSTYENEYNIQSGPMAPMQNNDYRMSQAPPVAASHNPFFSPQNAFYSNAGQAPMPSGQGIPGMEYLSNSTLLNAGLNAFGQGVKDITGGTVHMLPNEVKKSISSVRYYFAVDQVYVFKKLCLLLFPYKPRNWSLAYSTNGPVPPRVDSNAPDYYIPLMSAITYVLVAGLALGIQNRFSPEQLGMHASSVMVWNIIEICVLCLTFYIFNVQSKLRTLDLIAYCGYKYVGMTTALLCYLATHSLLVYRCALLYISLSLSYFLIRCLRLQILSESSSSHSYCANGSKRRIYLLLLIVILQPLFVWYLTRHLIAA